MDSNTVVKEFNKIYRDTKVLESKTRWMGVPINKYPTDLWIYQEILSTIKPDLIIETGTHLGANALYLASLLDIIGNGHVVSIDKDQKNFSKHHRITYLKNDPLDVDLLRHLSEITSKHKVVMVILNDSIKSEIVFEELINYYDFVSIGSYLIVENTCIDTDYEELVEYAGPMQAIDTFLYSNIQFIIDNTKDKFLLTANPNGYLIRMV